MNFGFETKNNDKKVKTEDAAKGCAVLVVICALFYFFGTCNSSKSDEKKSEEPVLEYTEHTKLSALENSRQCVEEQLKSPGTADWGYDEDKVVKYDDTSFLVTSYVDSENGFGAKIRTDYTAIVIFKSNGKINCKVVSIKSR